VIITKLTLENFGVFRGKHVFDFQPYQEKENNKSIILIGGMNGAGKTTIFEGIRLCLYGSNIDGFRLKKGAYEKYINSQIHQILGSPLQLDSASIEIEFEYSNLGNRDSYSVRRSWQRASRLEETLTIKKNGQELTELESSQWQDFINELIPPGISQLFFFDGEKIQTLAEDETDTIQLRDSFKSLLGLHIVDKLKTDLGIFLARKAKSAGYTALTDEYLVLQKEKKDLGEKLERLHQNLAQKHAYIDQLRGAIDRQELLIAGEGGAFAKKRDNLKLKRSKVESQIESEKSHIRELCVTLFPFALAPKYCRLVRERLRNEEAYQRYLNTQYIIDKIRKNIESQVKSEEFWKKYEVPSNQRTDFIQRIKEIVNEQTRDSDQFRDFRPIHQLSPIEYQKMLVWIDRSLHEVPLQMEEATTRLEKSIQERHKIENTLIKAPDDDVISPLIHQLNDLNKDLGQLQEQHKKEEEETRVDQNKLNEVERKIAVVEAKFQAIDFESQKIHLAKEVSDVLQAYSNELQLLKIQELSSVFLECFNRLSRKGKFISRIDINIEDFSIILYDHGGGIRPKSKLSVGEKQIYAIAMLWALTIVSGRPLPFVIDTPLGRLDSAHRGKLVRDFFPTASHQMIILSTDTEIDHRYFSQLIPNIARAYHLAYNPEEGMTMVTEGYFWEKPQKEVEA